MTLLHTSLIALAAMLCVARAGATTVETDTPAAAAWSTREQLRECLATADVLKDRARVIDAASAAHEKMSQEVEAENVRLQERHEQLDASNERAVKSFNALVKEHNQHVKALNQDAADTAPATEAYNADRVAFNHRCSGQRYRAEDMEAVTRERQKAAGQAAAASAAR